MSIGTKIVLAFTGLFFLFVLTFSCTTLSTYNKLITLEEGVKAQYKQNQNNYDNMWKKFREASQVPEMYSDDAPQNVAEIIVGKHRNGATGTIQLIYRKQFMKFENAMTTRIDLNHEPKEINLRDITV